ncbi:putative SNF2 family helicase [Aspergillus saccharolyticus JOP 1030-1]|uniref:SNF2 family helicase n=1 Tax=Aspergillus saccharolyticus JOP 1030-1 TaxID=1450539 RepID=A0A318ZZK2_9EURO|nr:hypothetical protein BP01DRAFT_396330 [Aspergillus saccharolyticus JOP 1030-1]PYH49650.1 hypothetical protein BP01DRAFT_396330 [Aspergillus saccharolyticus JOP 1030-1]
MDEEKRVRRVTARKAREAREAGNGASSSSDEDQKSVSDEQVPVKARAQAATSTLGIPESTLEANNRGRRLRGTRARKNRFSAEEKRKSKSYGLQAALKQAGHKAQGKTRKRKGENTATSLEMLETPARKKARKKIQGNEEFLKELLAPNVIEDAHASAAAKAMPETGERNKEKAFRRMIGSIPAEGLAEARSDHNKILDASRKFSKTATKDGTGGYRIPGMKTSLYHYQLLGAAFMRDRENACIPPYGGFLSDFMGLGKTIQALANIVDGRPSDPEDPVRTTLIVVPSQLVSHWKSQIIKHCDGIKLGEIATYRAGHRMDTLDIAESLQSFSVIITTYDEVRRSYPVCSKSSTPLGTEAEVSTRWDEIYEENRGPLHRIKFLRIILDEGHVIKNPASAVSRAVCALIGTYRWILTGTPIINYLDDLFPQFEFLGVPGVKDHERFIRDYCQDDVANMRLVNRMRSFMFRRTHASRILSFPIVKLPDVHDDEIRVQFCDAERELYDAIQDLFMDNINKLAEHKHPVLAQYRCFLTMILKLRMELLLIAIRKNPTVICDELKEHLVHSTILQGDKERLMKGYYEFMAHLHDREQWDERLERNSCPQCKSVPVYPIITSCHHLYCEECYSYLSVNADTAGGKPACCTCQEPINEAAYCDAVEDIELTQTQTAQNLRQTTQRTKRRRTGGKWGSFCRATLGNSSEEPVTEPDADEQTDWIQACAGQMPSAKLMQIREMVAQWLADSPNNKIVIFTQFLDFVRIMDAMCQKEGWPVVWLTGKMNLASREESIKVFSDKEGDTNILLASLKAGGIGLDLTAANKCILVDLWWNDAMQDQAFCRLWRIGQTQEVTYIKLIVDETIDEYLLALQLNKKATIEKIIGDDILKDRDTMESLMRMFADVKVEPNGAFRLTRKSKKSKAASTFKVQGKKKLDYAQEPVAEASEEQSAVET